MNHKYMNKIKATDTNGGSEGNNNCENCVCLIPGPTGPAGETPFFPVAYAVNDLEPEYTFSRSSVLIPLPSGQILQTGITANLDSTVFTIAEPGLYRISYIINIVTPRLVYSYLEINGQDYDFSAVDTGQDISTLNNEVIVEFTEGDNTVSLKLGAGSSFVSVELAADCGAHLIIQKLN